MNMASGNRPESFNKAVHLPSLIGQDRLFVDARRAGANDQTGAEELTYLRVKPDRRRIKAAYPPHLERRRTPAS
jgi:hypothetical protein